MKRGFTLIEVIAAVFVLTVGAGAAFALIQQTLVSNSLVEDRFIASYLAQEGIEIARNLRDKAWLEEITWNTYLPAGNQQADYSSQSLTPYNPNEVLKIDSNGFYSYSSGALTKFQRKINITNINATTTEVTVTVEWKERSRRHEIKAIDHLTNWREI